MRRARAEQLKRVIGSIEVAGGVYAIGATILGALFSPAPLRSQPLVSYLAMLVVGAVAASAGVGLLRGTSSGHRASLLVQVSQVPIVVTPLVHYSGFLLLRVVGALVGGAPTFSADIGGEWFAQVGSMENREPTAMVFGVNFLALAFCVVLLRERRMSGPPAEA